jgi:hypothetical protein
MKIFNKHLFGNDAEQFLGLPIINQIDWIKANTNQQNDDLIEEFLSNIPINNEKNCLNCGNISETIPNEVTTNIELSNDGEFSKQNSIKRPKTTKRRKT